MATTLVNTGVQFPDNTIQTTASTGGGRITVADTAPTVPTQGDVWYDSATAYRAFVWSSTAQAWVDLSPAGTAPVTNKVTVATVAPTSPATGDIWYDTLTNNRGNIWSGSAWLSLAPTSTSSGTGNFAQLFTSSGTFTIPTGVTRLKVSVVAGGGQGGNAYSTGGQNVQYYNGAAGAQGGSCIGWYVVGTNTPATPGNITVTVGLATQASSTSGTGMSTFSATGGPNNSTNSVQATSGIGSGGTLNIRGNGALFGAYGTGGAGGITAATEFDSGTAATAGSPGAVLFEW